MNRLLGKKPILLFLLACLFLSFAACSSPKETDTVTTTAPLPKTDLPTLKAHVLEAWEEYEVEETTLRQVTSRYPIFQLQGEILIIDSEDLFLWGRALGPAGVQSPGWQIEPGNLKVLKADEDRINHINQFYVDVEHFYVGLEEGRNAFGAKVPIKVYTTVPPTELAEQRKAVAGAFSKLAVAGAQLRDLAVSEYEPLLDEEISEEELKKVMLEVQELHAFLKQKAEPHNLYTLTEAFLFKQASDLEDNLAALYSLIDFYIAEGELARAQEVYTSIALGYPEVILELAEDPNEIWFVNSLFTNLGQTKNAVRAWEIAQEKDPSLFKDRKAAVAYGNHLRTLAGTEEESEKYLLQLNAFLTSDIAFWDMDPTMRELHRYCVESLFDLYLSQELFLEASRLRDEADSSYRSSDYSVVTDPERVLRLAEGLALQGEYQTSYRHLHQIIRIHRDYQDLDLVSDIDYVNLLLGLSYLSWSRGGDEIVPGLKYLHKAYDMNPENPITNNALGYYYYNRYANHREKFATFVPAGLSTEELILKVVGYYEAAIRLDPDYRRAWGNLGNIISSAGYQPEVADALRDLYKIPEGRHISYDPEFKKLKDLYWERSRGRNGLPVDGVESVKSFGEHVR